MYKTYIISGAFFAFMAVVLGAAGAHIQTEVLEKENLNRFDTALKYQFYHSFALIFCGILYMKSSENNWIKYSGYAFIAGIVLFSFSLYILVFTGNENFAQITPFGGLSFLAGWLFIIIGTLKIKKPK